MENVKNNTTIATYSTKQSIASTLFIWSAVFIVVGFLIFILNFTTLVTFIINRHLRRRSVYCLLNLAVADMLYGVIRIIQQSLVIVRFLGRSHNEKGRTGFLLVGHLVFFASLFCLVLVSLERVYVTYFPFRHRTTRLRVYVLSITITWSLPLLPTFTSYFLPLDRYYLLIVSVSFLVCLIIICTSYTAILVKVKRRHNQLQINQQQSSFQMAQSREQHLAMTLFIVTVLSLMTWFPLIIFLALKMWYTSLSNSVYSLNVFWSIWLIQTANSFVNPIVYVFRMRDFRKALTQLVFKCGRNRNRIHPVTVLHHANQVTIQEYDVSRIG